MRRVVLSLVLILVAATPALAQLPQTDGSPVRLDATFAPTRAPRAVPAYSGLTVLVNVGLGIQTDSFYEMTETGLGGPNFGVGWFLNERTAVMFRYSGTSVEYSDLGITQRAGVWGGSLQYWLNTWASVEAGVGLGRWSDSDGISDNGWGLIFGFHATVWQMGAHHIRVGAEYAPTFTGSTVHNIGIVGGYQYAK